MIIFYKKRKKYNEIQFTKNKMDLNIRKMTNHPPSPDSIYFNSTPQPKQNRSRSENSKFRHKESIVNYSVHCIQIKGSKNFAVILILS